MRLALFEPEIAGNAGAATRAAACFAAGLDIIEPCGFPLNARGFARAAMDYGLMAPPTVHASWAAFAASDTRRAGRLILLTTKAALTIWDVDFGEADTLLIGKESAGVPDHVRAAADLAARIPMAPGARSLNMAAAAAVGLAAARRSAPLHEAAPSR